MPDIELIKDAIELGGSFGTTVLFIWYLFQKNGRQEKTMEKLSASIDRSTEKLSASLDRNTKVLIRVARNHKLMDDADDLMID